ncbi:hypothetical protein BLA29_012171 [Euroglyphus maynei]|uniref:Uncharacterized protein n=1 Tax=Euroglyphus maynei TaxID=6958 RepID=A0A1Y3B8U5_EURMA|nr:hypothetical protein BLA29_012171 [Euroglyphus maynei]
MSRYVFHINLNELPMDKTISDRKRELRNKPRLHHIRSVSSANQQSNEMTNTTKINQNHQQQQQHHDQNSRTSSQPDSSKVPVQRLLSNDSTSDNIIGSRHQRTGRHPKISTPLLHLVSVNRHPFRTVV